MEEANSFSPEKPAEIEFRLELIDLNWPCIVTIEDSIDAMIGLTGTEGAGWTTNTANPTPLERVVHDGEEKALAWTGETSDSEVDLVEAF